MTHLYTLCYNGSGSITVTRVASPDLAVFGEPRLNCVTHRMETEWIPGWGVVAFDQDTWDCMAKVDTMTVLYPQWTSEAYCEWLKANK